MQISVDTKTVHQLAAAMKATLTDLGTPIGFARARTIVTRAFGYRDYDELLAVNKYIGDPRSDCAIKSTELKQRIKIYIAGLLKSGFTKDEARQLLSKVSTPLWWGIKKGRLRSRWTPREATPPRPKSISVPDTSDRTHERFIADIAAIPPSRVKIHLGHVGIAKKMARDLNVFAKAHDMEIIGRNDLMAKLFGHDSFADLQSSIGSDTPTEPDWQVPIEQLGDRIAEYFRILMAAGFSAEQTKEVLRVVGVDGWWSFAELRQRMIQAQQLV